MSKSILITGTSSGVGRALLRACHDAGWQAFGTVRKTDDADSLTADGLNALMCDVTDDAGVQAAVEHVIATTGRLDAVIANAGIGYVRNIEQAPTDEVAHLFDVNVHGVFRTAKAALPHMRAARRGHILAVSSVGGLVGQPFNELYCSTKFAVEGFIEGLASYVTPGFGIDFTLVEPGGISSGFADTVRKQVAATGGIHDDAYAPLMQAYLGGAASRGTDIYQTPEEVAAIILATLELDRPPLRLRTSPWSEHFTRFKTQADPTGHKSNTESIRTMLGEDAVRDLGN